jgi:hypothetical protein
MSDSKADDCAEQKEEAKPDYLANIKRGPALHERERCSSIYACYAL